jgi:UDP-glucose 4-epimerase
LEKETHLVLGGSGFIGRHVALRLAQRGHRVIIADHHPPPPLPLTLEASKVEFANVDLLLRDWQDLVAQSDVVHHYFWTTIPQTANENPSADLDANVGTTLWLLNVMKQFGGKRMIFTSSGGSVYGHIRSTPIPESHPLNPISAYGVSKVAAEKYIGFFSAQYGVDGRIARLSNPFGAGQNPNRGQGAVSTFLARALKGEQITVWGDGTVVRDYLHIADVAAALVRLAEATLEPTLGSSVYNISSGEGRSLNQIIAAVEVALNRAVSVKYDAGRSFDVPVSILDIAHTVAVLDWRPRLNFEQGLELMLKDMRSGCTSYSSLD